MRQNGGNQDYAVHASTYKHTNTHRQQRNGGIKIEAKVEKTSWRKITIRKKLFIFLSLAQCFISRDRKCSFVRKKLFSCSLKNMLI